MTPLPCLETERLILRDIRPEDSDAFVDYFCSDRAAYTGGPMTPKAAWRHLAANIGHWALRGFGMFSVTLKGSDKSLGIVGHWFPHGWAEREVGWILYDATNEGKGIASEAARACIAHAFGPLGWDTAVSYISPENENSIRLAERLGASLDPNAPKPDTTTVPLIYRHRRPE